jgi:hypothetical protein
VEAVAEAEAVAFWWNKVCLKCNLEKNTLSLKQKKIEHISIS